MCGENEDVGCAAARRRNAPQTQTAAAQDQPRDPAGFARGCWFAGNLWDIYSLWDESERPPHRGSERIFQGTVRSLQIKGSNESLT